MDVNGIDNLRQQKDAMTASLKENMDFLNRKLDIDKNFDLVYRVIQIGGREACMYFVDGFCKDELMQKMLQRFMDIKPEELPENAMKCPKNVFPMLKWICNLISVRSFILSCPGYLLFLLMDMISVF